MKESIKLGTLVSAIDKQGNIHKGEVIKMKLQEVGMFDDPIMKYHLKGVEGFRFDLEELTVVDIT